VKLGPDDRMGDAVALAGEGPHAPVAARRADEFVATDAGASLTLLNVQQPNDGEGDDGSEDPMDRGHEIIEDVAADAGLAAADYEPEVVGGDDVEETVLAAVEEYDTVCVGATRAGAVSQALFGSLPERVGAEADATVAMVRGEEGSPRTIREAIVERLSP
jgi:nucleotide-binding universal stress UspA family protein